MWSNVALILIISISSFGGTAVAQVDEECRTPNQETGRCISIYDCTVLYNALTTRDSNQRRFLQQSQCGYSKSPLVCCGTLNNFDATPRISPTTSRTTSKRLVQDNECGFQQADRILDGTVAGLDEFPWMALLQYRKNGKLKFACGGTLISKRYVLTAAHCVTGPVLTVAGQLVNVRLGEHNTNTDIDCIEQFGIQACNEASVDVGIEKTIFHPRYSNSNANRYNDIALIKLDRDVVFTDFIRRICLPTVSDRSNIGDQVIVAGWGRTEFANSSPVKLKLKIPIAEKGTCSARFGSAGIALSDAQLCAGGQKGRDSCTGDSGGPLMRTKRSSSQWYIEGIVSFGASCGSEGWPGVYTKVSEYVDWIQNNTN